MASNEGTNRGCRKSIPSIISWPIRQAAILCIGEKLDIGFFTFVIIGTISLLRFSVVFGSEAETALHHDDTDLFDSAWLQPNLHLPPLFRFFSCVDSSIFCTKKVFPRNASELLEDTFSTAAKESSASLFLHQFSCIQSQPTFLCRVSEKPNIRNLYQHISQDTTIVCYQAPNYIYKQILDCDGNFLPKTRFHNSKDLAILSAPTTTLPIHSALLPPTLPQ